MIDSGKLDLQLSPELVQLIDRLQHVVQESTPDLDIFTIAGALIGAGVELALRSGCSKVQVAQLVDTVIPQIAASIEAGPQ